MIALDYGRYYHIYNRGNNRENLFKTDDDYNHFLHLYEKYICTVADTYAWVLMKNHFHLLVRIKEEKEIGYYLPLNSDGSNDSFRFKTTGNNLTESEGPVRVVVTPRTNSEGPVRVVVTPRTNSEGPVRVVPDNESLLKIKKPNTTNHFSHLFNAYTKYFNNHYHRTGSLFQRPFNRIEINSDAYFCQLVVYIHTNPVHHKIAEDFTEYKWSSFQSIISTNPSQVYNHSLIEWFGDLENLLEMHYHKLEIDWMVDVWLE